MSIQEVPFYFSRSSVKFQGHTGWKIYDLNPIWVTEITRPVAAIKSLKFALFSLSSDFPQYTMYKNYLIGKQKVPIVNYGFNYMFTSWIEADLTLLQIDTLGSINSSLSILVGKNFLTWLLIGWGLRRQPVLAN